MSQLDILKNITNRRAVRAFTSQSVSRETIDELLNVAARAPSGANSQPWKVYVVTGEKRDQIAHDVCDAYDMLLTDPELHNSLYQEQFPYYPNKWVSPYIDRRRQNGWELYGLLDIQKGDKDKMHEQQRRNFEFFDAPIGLFFTVDQIMGVGAKMDASMMMQNFMLAAKAVGLDTCPQAGWNHYHSIILPHLGVDDEDEELICGMALGYKDETAIVNTLQTPRETVANFSRFFL